MTEEITDKIVVNFVAEEEYIMVKIVEEEYAGRL